MTATGFRNKLWGRAARLGALAALLATAPLALPGTAWASQYSSKVLGGPTVGEWPSDAPILFQGDLYVTTYLGGAYGHGGVVRISKGSGKGVIYSFSGGHDGGNPAARLVAFGGLLWGTTELGGNGFGNVFTLNPTTGAETVSYTFTGGSDGYLPQAGLTVLTTATGTMIYGMAEEGGVYDCGTVFAINPATGAETLVYSFTGYSDGKNPIASLITLNGTLYGTTPWGGTPKGGYFGCTGQGCGVVFALNPTTGVMTKLYSFTGGSDGGAPFAGVTALGGMLYGTTSVGGAFNVGTVFSLNPSTGAETVLHSFSGGSDGASPFGSLAVIGSTLYGTTSSGGAYGLGTVFSLNPATGAETVLHSFSGGTDGANPVGLTVDSGTLYGATQYGGGTKCFGSGCGTVFMLKP